MENNTTQRIKDYEISVITYEDYKMSPITNGGYDICAITSEKYKIFIKDFEKLSFVQIFILQNVYYDIIINSSKTAKITIPIIEEFIHNTKVPIENNLIEQAYYRYGDDSVDDVIKRTNIKDSARYYLTVCASLINWVVSSKHLNDPNYNNMCVLSKILVERFGAIMLLAHFGFQLRDIIASNQFDRLESSDLKFDVCSLAPHYCCSDNINNHIEDSDKQEIVSVAMQAVNYLLDLTNLKDR